MLNTVFMQAKKIMILILARFSGKGRHTILL